MKSYALSLTSAFSTTSLLKARVKMLYRKPSTKLALVKFGFAFPVLVLCIMVNACMQRMEPTLSDDGMVTVTTTDHKTGITTTKRIKVPNEVQTPYQKVSNEIGLTKILDVKNNYSNQALMDFYYKIPKLAEGKVKTTFDIDMLQGEVFAFLLKKGLHKSTERKELTFVAEGILKHEYVNVYFLLKENDKELMQKFLPNLKKQWTEIEYKAFATKLLATYVHLDKTTKTSINGVSLTYKPLVDALNEQM